MVIGNLLPCETYRGGLWGRKHDRLGNPVGHLSAIRSRARRYNYKSFTLKGWRAVWSYRTTEAPVCECLFHIKPARFLVKR